MENEIKVNDYVRLKDGTIAKVIKIKNQNTDIFNWYCLDNDMGTMDRSIVKHSPNLIDLIQCGDYVNGYKVISVLDGFADGTMEIELSNHTRIYRHHIEDIEEVITKEMMESISYKVTKM